VYAYAWTAEPDDEDLAVDTTPANDNVEAGIAAVLPADVDAVKAVFWAKFVESRPRLGRLRHMRDFLKSVVLLFEMLIDPTCVIPWRTTAGIVFALAYFISPFDLIPDAIPVIGFLDDALVVAEVIYMFSADIQRYEESRRRRRSFASSRA
jgi:uncharacterized membrane protein YkvA (DUF1232 family)